MAFAEMDNVHKVVLPPHSSNEYIPPQELVFVFDGVAPYKDSRYHTTLKEPSGSRGVGAIPACGV